MSTIIAKVLGQGTGDTPEQIAFEVRYTLPSGLTEQFVTQVIRTWTDTEMESSIREQVAAHATANHNDTYTETDVRGGKI